MPIPMTCTTDEEGWETCVPGEKPCECATCAKKTTKTEKKIVTIQKDNIPAAGSSLSEATPEAAKAEVERLITQRMTDTGLSRDLVFAWLYANSDRFRYLATLGGVTKSLAAEFVKSAYEHREKALALREDLVRKSGTSTEIVDEVLRKAHDAWCIAPVEFAKIAAAHLEEPTAKIVAAREEMIEKMVIDHAMTRVAAETFLAAESSAFKALNDDWGLISNARADVIAKAEIEARSAMIGISAPVAGPAPDTGPTRTASEAELEKRAEAIAKVRGVSPQLAMTDALQRGAHHDPEMVMLYEKANRERTVVQKGGAW